MAANTDIRERMKQAEIKSWALAYKLHIDESTISRWLRTPLTEERRAKIEAAIDEMEKE